MVTYYIDVPSMERIAIIIPTTGQRQTLVDAITSVFGQKSSRGFILEVIVVNDGKELLVDLSDFDDLDNFKIISTGGFKGANFARNMGVKHTDAEWISFLDDDDLWYSNKLKEQFENREKNTLLFCKKMFFTDHPQQIERCSRWHSGNLLIFNYIGSTSSIFLSRKMFNKVGGFKNDLPALQDWDFYVRLKKADCRFQLVNGTHIYYRLSPNGRISTNLARQYRAVVLLATKDLPSPVFLLGLVFHLTRITCKRLLFQF